MRDILNDTNHWLSNQEPVALATVIRTWGSSPRQTGAKMALTPDGKIAGSVSGGCVEGAVFETGREVLKTGQPQLLHFGVADETAWEVGLACGGQIDVFVEPLKTEFFERMKSALFAEQPFALATVIRGPDDLLGRSLMVRERDGMDATADDLDRLLIEKTYQALAEGRSQVLSIETGGKNLELFVEVVKPAPALVIVGGVHIAIALTALAQTLGYITTVVDPRRAFGSAERFPHAGRLIGAWPDEAFEQIALTSETAVAMLTHDPKIDDPALKIVLNSPAFYVGALGSQKTQEKRRQRLLAEGLTPAQLDRLHGPIGLDIGAETPEEIALAVMAQIVAAKHQR